MSGEPNRDDELDFEDFILEDAPAGDLEDIFAESPAKPARTSQPAPDAPPDEQDVLFADHTPAGEASETFDGREQFAEVSSVRWAGHKMPVQDIGIPESEETPDPLTDLNEDFPIDSDQELEVVHDDRELEEVLAADDGDATPAAAEDVDWSLEEPEEAVVLDDDQAPLPAGIYAEDGDSELVEELVASTADDSDGEAAAQDEQYEVEEGWEPIGADLGDLAPDSDEQEQPAAAEYVDGDETELELVGAAVGAEGDAELYYEDTPPAVIGAQPRRRRLAALLPPLVAATVLLGAGAVVVLRPQWVGLDLTPQLVERVEVARPDVQFAIAEPRLPPPQVAQHDPVPTDPQPGDPTNVTPTDPLAQQDPTVDPQPGDPVPQPVDPIPQPTDPVAQQDPLPIGAPPHDPLGTVPIATAPGVGAPKGPVAEEAPKLMPAGETLWIGEFATDAERLQAIQGVTLGANAFAQLFNGNFFIGTVKAVNADAVVLKLERGEVTLPLPELERITAIDSVEYAQLQKSTVGFLRLSNNNRLTGAILSSIDDDAVVLQMRSDRVVVPRAAVSRIVASEEDAVRFAEGDDEDLWLREFATRQLRAMAASRVAAPGGESKGRTPGAPPAGATPPGRPPR